MISDVKAAIISKIQEIYPSGYTIYDEDLPVSVSKPAFLIQITNQSYSRQAGNKYLSELSFDISYYSAQTAIRADMIGVQEAMLQAFDLIGTYQIKNKVAKITDNVLHFTFNIRYSEAKEEAITFMQHQKTNTKI